VGELAVLAQTVDSGGADAEELGDMADGEKAPLRTLAGKLL